MKVPFNRPFLVGKEVKYIQKAVESGKISGNGWFTKQCHKFFHEKYGFKNCLLTTSCTDALEMAAILCKIKDGDEVIAPAYAFVSTVNAFVLRGATLVFADSEKNHPNIDAEKIEKLITQRTKAIVVIHYAGVACNMNKILELAGKYGLFVIEDAAQSIDSYYNGKPLGSFGHFATFSFHETKNIISGEGGMLVINDETKIDRALVIWEKGTNRVAFSNGEVNKYQWVDIGSSFLPSEVTAAFLFAQLEQIDIIQSKRRQVWNYYHEKLNSLERDGLIKLPYIHDMATNNGHIFYMFCKSREVRDELLKFLNGHGIHAVFHYLALNNSPYFLSTNETPKPCPNAVLFEFCLLRLPLFLDITYAEQDYVIEKVYDFFNYPS